MTEEPIVSQIHVIWNPVAGNHAAEKSFALICRRLDGLGVDYTTARSSYPGHSAQLAADAVRFGHACVVAVGGDGTVREVASALQGTGVPMGIIPSGTGNDLSRALNIPHDPLAALDVVLAGYSRQMDAAEANGEEFFNIAGFGFDVDVLDYTEIYKKKTANGSLAYMRGLFAAITKLRLRKTHITTPEGEMDKNVLFMAVGNGTHFGGGMNVTPNADPFDGLLDVCIVHDVNMWNLLTLLTNFKSGKHIQYTKYVTYFRTTRLTAACDPASRIEVDGEVMPGTPVTFEVRPKALWVFVPKNA